MGDPAVLTLRLRGSSERASREHAWPCQARQAGGRSRNILSAGSFVRESSFAPSGFILLMLIPSTPFSLWRYLNFSACKLRRVNESQHFFVAPLHSPWLLQTTGYELIPRPEVQASQLRFHGDCWNFMQIWLELHTGWHRRSWTWVGLT